MSAVLPFTFRPSKQPAPCVNPLSPTRVQSSDSNFQPETMPLRRLLIVFGFLFAAAALAPASVQAQNADVIRGQVIGPDSQPVKNVRVTVTSISGNVSRTAVTGEE